jgi:hypothetical protein
MFSKDILVQNVQPVGLFQSTKYSEAEIFQYNIFRQKGYFSTIYSDSRDITVQYVQSVGILQYKVYI